MSRDTREHLAGCMCRRKSCAVARSHDINQAKRDALALARELLEGGARVLVEGRSVEVVPVAHPGERPRVLCLRAVPAVWNLVERFGSLAVRDA